jgi:hypothetical protein
MLNDVKRRDKRVLTLGAAQKASQISLAHRLDTQPASHFYHLLTDVNPMCMDVPARSQIGHESTKATPKVDYSYPSIRWQERRRDLVVERKIPQHRLLVDHMRAGCLRNEVGAV